MIFTTLDQMGIPYIVVRFYISSLTEPWDVGAYHYQIIVNYDRRLTRLSFRPEKEIYRYKDQFMYRILSECEIGVLRAMNPVPARSSAFGTVWEFNGTLKKRVHPLKKQSLPLNFPPAA